MNTKSLLHSAFYSLWGVVLVWGVVFANNVIYEVVCSQYPHVHTYINDIFLDAAMLFVILHALFNLAGTL